MSSILERIKKQQSPEGKRLFGVVCGPRLGGKTTLAGTLPGRTLLLQSVVRESGSESAQALAKLNGHQLDVANFSTVEELLAILKECSSDEAFDNVYVDGLSSITDQKFDDPVIRKLVKTDNWAAFREIGAAAETVIMTLKELTYPEKTKKPKNTWITCALDIKLDKNGSVADVSLSTKGNLAATAVTKFGECVVTVLPPTKTEAGETGHRMITRTTDWWPGRIDGLLHGQNPGMLDADLSKLLALRAAK